MISLSGCSGFDFNDSVGGVSEIEVERTLQLPPTIFIGCFDADCGKSRKSFGGWKYRCRSIGVVDGYPAVRFYLISRLVGISCEISLQVDGLFAVAIDDEVGLGHPVKKIFQIGVTVAIVIIIVVCHCGIESVGFFPPVGHTVVVGVIAFFSYSCIDVQSRKSFTAGVFFRVYKTGLARTAALGWCSAGEGLRNHTAIMVVGYGQGASYVTQHILIGGTGRLDIGFAVEKRLVCKWIPDDHLSWRYFTPIGISTLVFGDIAMPSLLSDVTVDVCTLGSGTRSFYL